MILVTGATGNIGTALVQELTDAHQPTRALVRDKTKAGALAQTGAEIVEGDFFDAASLDRAFAGVERVFILSPGDPRLGDMHNAVTDAAVRAGTVRHVVNSAALGANPHGPVRMWRWHGEAEEHLRASGLPCTLLRPTSFAQGLLQSAPIIQSQNAFIDPMGDAPTSWVDVRDIARVARVLLTEDPAAYLGKAYDLTGGKAYTGAETAALLGEVTGRPIRYQPVPFDAYQNSLAQAGLPQWLAEGLTELDRALAGGPGALVTDAVQTLTGQAPIPLETFLRENAAAFSA